MLFRATAKSWRSSTSKASTTPDRKSKSYRTGRALGQIARGQKPTKYSEPERPNPLEGRKNVANITAYKDGTRFDYGYDADTGDLYDIRYGLQHDVATGKEHGLPGGVKVTNLMNVKEYQPVNFGGQFDRPGQIPGRGMKGRKYTGVDAVVKALRDEGGDVFVLDKTPGKGKQASTTGRVPHWRSPITATGEYVDPRRRHDIPAGSNPAKTAHNMFWRQASPISEQEKRARGVLERGTAQDTIRKAYGKNWRGPQSPPPTAGPSPSPQGPKPGPPTGFGGDFDQFLARQGINPGNMGANWRPKPASNPPGHTPGPPPSQNQATGSQSSRYVAWHSPHDVKPAAGQTRSGAASAGLGDAFSTDSHEYAAQYGKPVRYSFNMNNPYAMPQSEWRDLDRGPHASFENSRKFRQKLESQGHDGIIVTHRDGTKEYITFDRTKSAFQPFEEDPSVATPPPSQNQAKPTGTAIQPWRRPVIQVPQAQKPIDGPDPLDSLPGYVAAKNRDWYGQKEGAKTQYGTGPKARKLRPVEPKTAVRAQRPANQPVPEPEILPSDPLALMPPAQVAEKAPAWRKSSKPKAEAAIPVTQPGRADVFAAENALQNDFHQSQMVKMADSGKGKPFAYDENVARNIGLAHQGDHFGTQSAFESDDLIDSTGRQVQPKTIKAIAGATDDIALARMGIVPKKTENPFEYSTEAGPDTMPFGTEGDMQIQGRLGIAERTIQAIEAERATNPDPNVDYDRAISQVLIDQAAPAKVLMQQREFLAAAAEARAKGDNKLADKIESFAGEIAAEADRRSPKMLDAFSTMKEDSGQLTRGTYLSSPQQEVSKINAMDRRDFARFIPEFAASEPKRSDFPTQKEYDKAIKKWSLEATHIGRSGIEDFDVRKRSIEDKITLKQPLTPEENQFILFARQAELDEANLGFSRATGQGGSNPADTKMFNTVALPSPVPWTDDKQELLAQVPPTQYADINADTQFTRELDRPEVGNSRFGYKFEPQRFEPRQDVPLEDQLAEAMASRFASVSRHLGSLGFGANAVEAAGNRQMLQGQEGDEGFAPQGTSKHWSSLGTVEKQLEAIEGGGKVPGMEDLRAATYDATFPEYQAKARDFLATLPPDMPDDQFQAAAQEFMRSEFNRRLQSDYERHTNPEMDTTGGHNIFRMPNTKTMIKDDPTKQTLQQVADAEIPGIVLPQSGDPYAAWNERLQKEEADRNVQNAYGMVDQGVYEKANDFWNDPLNPPSPDVALAAERFLNDKRNPERKRAAATEAGTARDAAEAGYGEKGPVRASMGLRRGAKVDKGWRSTQPKPDAFRNPDERLLEKAMQTSDKQGIRQDRYLFAEPGTNKSQNVERIEADQLALDDVVNLHVPTKSGGKIEQARVTDIVDGQVVLEDGDAFGNIVLDPDDPSRSSINVQSIEPHPDPAVRAERRLAQILGGKAPVQAQAESAPVVPEIAGQPEIQPATGPGPKKAQKGSKTPGLEPAAFEALYGTPFQQIIQGEVSKIASPRAQKGKLGGEYDGGMDFGNFWNSKIFARQGGRKPDQVHAELVDKGLMPSDSTVDDMWVAIGRDIVNYHGQVDQVRQGKIQVQQAERVQKEVFSPKSAKRNPVAIRGSEMVVGQQIEIAVPNAKGRKDQTELAEVVDIDEDGTAILEDGPRYGPFTVGENDTIYGKRILEGNIQPDDPWANPEPFDIQQTAAPKAFTLQNETPNMNYDTNQGIMFDEDNEVDRMLREEQRRKNRRRLGGQSDFLGDVPF